MKKKLGFFVVFCSLVTFPVSMLAVDSQKKAIIKKGDFFPEISLQYDAACHSLPSQPSVVQQSNV